MPSIQNPVESHIKSHGTLPAGSVHNSVPFVNSHCNIFFLNMQFQALEKNIGIEGFLLIVLRKLKKADATNL